MLVSMVKAAEPAELKSLVGSAAAVLAIRVWHLDPSGQVLTPDLQRSVVAADVLEFAAVLELVAEL